MTTVAMPGTNSPAMRKPIATGMHRNAASANSEADDGRGLQRDVGERRDGVEREARPSAAARTSSRPAWRAARWYGTVVWVKPTHAVIPRR